ncbi:MAG TPA: CSLREA domain-containing protein, partial [Actinomycetota bacterium]|nr:CSLREA domain-containing protein [Actinomycetota bacterium]
MLVPLFLVGLLQVVGASPALAVGYEVNSVADPGDGVCDASCTLRDAILASNASAGTPDAITFDTSLDGMTIQPSSALPAVTDPVSIDGDTDAGVGVSRIVINGSNAGASADGLTVSAGATTIQNLVVNGFDGRGLLVQTAGGDTLSNLIVGLDAAGTSDVGNGGAGVELLSSTNTVQDSVISGNGGSGIRIAGGSSGHAVSGNLIGTSGGGNAAIGNDAFGVEIEGAVSATDLGPGNVISGNASHGVSMLGVGSLRPTDIRVKGNRIGVGLDGATDVGNGKDGVRVQDGGAGIVIGGSTPAERNVISGNGESLDGISGYGIQMSGFLAAYTVTGNYIGTDSMGTSALANVRGGASIQGDSSRVGGTTGVTPGGSCTGECNLISGNGAGGLTMGVSGSGVTAGNYIGTDVTGTLDLGNAGFGIGGTASGGTPLIGGTSAAARNVIAGNGSTGISISDVNANGYTIQGNSIGVGATGAALGNDGHGVLVGGDRNLIGGTGAAEGNVIANNGGVGVLLLEGTPAQDNRILGNAILGNLALGIDLQPSGVTANDEDDPDGGANGRQNFPVITGAFVGNGKTYVAGTLNSTPGETFRIEAFASPACDGSGFGEGGAFVGAVSMPTQGS